MKLRWIVLLSLLTLLYRIDAASEDESDEGSVESSATELENFKDGKGSGNQPDVVAGSKMTEDENGVTEDSESTEFDEESSTSDDEMETSTNDDEMEASTNDDEMEASTNDDEIEASTGDDEMEASTSDDDDEASTDTGEETSMDNDSRASLKNGTRVSSNDSSGTEEKDLQEIDEISKRQILPVVDGIIEEAGRRAMENAIAGNSPELIDNMVATLYSLTVPAQELLEGSLEVLSKNVADNINELSLVFKKMIDNQRRPQIIAQVLQGSRLKMSPEANYTCLQLLSTNLETKYFGKVFRVLGEYFGWVMMSFYMTGAFLPESWDDAKIVIARMLIAINLEDCEEIRDINAIIAEREADDYKIVKSGYAVAFEEGRKALLESYKMLELLDLMRPILAPEIDEKRIRALVVDHLEHMADHSRTSLSYALREILSRNDPTMTGAVLEHLTQPSIGTPQNIVIFAASLIDDEISTGILSEYLAKLSTIPEKVSQLKSKISRRLSRLDSVRNYLHTLKVIMEVTKRTAVQMIPVVKASEIEYCNQAVGVVYLALLTAKRESLQDAWKLIDDDKFKACSPRRLVSALETAAIDVPRVLYGWSKFFNKKLNERPDAMTLVQNHRDQYPNVAKLVGA
jgi:hypothetical protein